MKLSKLLVIAVVAAAFVTALVFVPLRTIPGQAAPSTPQSSGEITAAGHGGVAVKPDQASITLGVQMRADLAKSAYSLGQNRMNKLVTAIVARGVSKSHIQTTDLSLWYDSEHHAYVCSSNVTVRLNQVQKLGAVIDAAIAAGANSSWGVSFGLRNTAGPSAKALKAAIADAHQRAVVMAAAMGVTLGGSTSVSEASVGNVTGKAPYPSGGGGGGGFQPGQYTVTADVAVTYSYHS